METLTENILRVLIVDDDPDDKQFFSEAITALGLPALVQSAANYDELFAALGIALPHLIFLDINLPGTNGLQCLKELKAHATYNPVPVIMYSVSFSANDINEAFESGAHHYIIKPYAHMNLETTLQKTFVPDWRTVQPKPERSRFVINEAFA